MVLLFSWLFKKKQHSNVIPFPKKKAGKSSGAPQVCSKCKKRLPLTFYASDKGAVRGLCQDCARETGKHEELYPI